MLLGSSSCLSFNTKLKSSSFSCCDILWNSQQQLKGLYPFSSPYFVLKLWETLFYWSKPLQLLLGFERREINTGKHFISFVCYLDTYSCKHSSPCTEGLRIEILVHPSPIDWWEYIYFLATWLSLPPFLAAMCETLQMFFFRTLAITLEIIFVSVVMYILTSSASFKFWKRGSSMYRMKMHILSKLDNEPTRVTKHLPKKCLLNH